MTHVLMAVPVHLVGTVGDLIAADAGSNGSAATTVDSGGLINGWTEEDIRDHYRNSSENMKKFLVFLAQHADEEVTSEDAAQAIGLDDWNSVAGMLGAAQRRAGNHYGLEEPPWSQRWTYDEGHRRFKMPAAVAAVVLNEAGE